MRAQFAHYASLLIVALAGCGKLNPCPRGMTRMMDRCVRQADGGVETGMEHSSAADRDADDDRDTDGDADNDPSAMANNAMGVARGPETPLENASSEAAVPDTLVDAGSAANQEAGTVVSMDAQAPLDSTMGPLDEAATEAASPADAEADGNDDADNAMPDAAAPLCSAVDLEAWRNFMMSGRNVLATSDCYLADPQCGVSTCALDGCLRGAAGVGGCASCVAAEVACVALNCQVQCGTTQVDDACRKCACARGCTTIQGGCGASEVPVCADCLGPTCSNFAVNPVLIMNVVDYALIVSPMP